MKRFCCVQLSGGVDSAFHSASRLSKYLGVFPYELKSRKLKLSKCGLLWSLLLKSIIVTIEILLILDPPSELNKSFIGTFLIWVQLGSLTAGLMINLLWLHNTKEKLEVALSLLNDVHDKLVDSEMNVSLVSPFLSLLMITIIATVGSALNFDYKLNTTILYISYYLTSVMICGVALQLSGTLQFTKHFFKELRLRLPKPSSQTCASVDLLIECHEILITACEAVNQAYAPQLLLIILSSFVLVTGNSYSVLVFKNPSDIVLLISWALLFAHLTWHIISACDATYTEVSYLKF